MKKIISFCKKYLHFHIVAFVALLCIVFLIVGHTNEKGYVSLTGEEVVINEGTKEFIAEAQEAIIEYAKTAVPTIIENADGTLSEIDAPTVDYIDGGPILGECPASSTECALGAVLPSLDITSPQTVYDSLINQCVDFDGAWGSQCYDEMAYFHYVYTGRWLSTNGTGGAYGIWDARDYNNSGNEYELIYDATQIKAGDWVVFHNGYYGHVGMALGGYNNGYVALLGTNQGGPACAGGGAVASVINMNLSSFSGAFRPRIWIRQPEPTPSPISDCGTWQVQQGDTIGNIMLVCEGYVDWSSIYSYANKWISQSVYPGKSVLWGWQNNTHYGLFAGDTIKFSE